MSTVETTGLNDGTARDAVVVDFWFDPSCPFTWTTSTWIRSLDPSMVTVRWRLMSLPVLNADADITPEYRAIMVGAVSPLRVLAAAGARTGSGGLGALYEAMGRRRHVERRTYGPDLYREALIECGLDPDLSDAADDSHWDEVVAVSHQQGQASVGQPSGSPVLAFDGQRGFFGPVLSAAPTRRQGAELLAACRVLAATDEFAEIKRARSTT